MRKVDYFFFSVYANINNYHQKVRKSLRLMSASEKGFKIFSEENFVLEIFLSSELFL